jgi:hypothetical protein
MKRIFALLLTLALALSLTACGSVKIEDTNGPDNFALNTITDQNILKRDLPSGGYGTKTSGLLSKTVTHSGKDFSGVVEVLWTDMIAGDFVLDLMDFTVTGGNFRMVLVHEGAIVADIAPGTTEIVLKDVKGDVALRIAGESADFSFSMTEFEYDLYSHP